MNLSIGKILRDYIKPELNLIYSTPPFDVEGETDFGWFCREHAYHLFLMARLLKLKSNVILGNTHIKAGSNALYTIGLDRGHAWCSIDSVNPVDISIFLEHFQGFLHVGAIYGSLIEYSSPYVVKYYKVKTTQIEKDLTQDDEFAIIYFEQECLDNDPIELVQNPFSILLKPSSGKKFTDIYGDDIYSAITLHITKLARGKVKPVNKYLETPQAIKTILKWNANAREELLR